MPDATTQDDDYLLPKSDRLQILTPEEYELLWGFPQFSDNDRAIYFQLTPRDEGVLSRLRTPRSKAHFLLQLGYFRARQRFFQLDNDQVHDDAYASSALKPVRRIKENPIISEWPNIEQILLSLALKSTSQSVIVSKLSSHRRQNRTKQALWEFEHIIRSLYLLDYVDSPLLRRNVHRALNRGESYHRLRRAIAYAHGGRFRVRSQHEQELWNECTRLIANAVVYYNSAILSELLRSLESASNAPAIDTLRCVTPLAWQHINFYGRYRFDGDLKPINLTEMAAEIARSNSTRWASRA